MAETARLLLAEATIYTYGSEIVQPAERWTFQASPSGIVYSLVFHPIPPPAGSTTVWTPEAIAQQRDEWANLLAGLLALPNVTGVAQTQEIDDLNNLHELTLVSVRSDSGVASRVLSFKTGDILPPSPVPEQIAQAVADLNTAAGG